MVFNYPFSGTLLTFTEDVEVAKHPYCPICYWKGVRDIASSWSLRLVHVSGIIILLIMLTLFFTQFFLPITAMFSTPLSFADLLILLFLDAIV